ncbi:MAG TPA: dual specificity protein phosphatase family protein [Tepidisphaeraceae bacterium]|jgi:protein-tyrosine phosphatase
MSVAAAVPVAPADDAQARHPWVACAFYAIALSILFWLVYATCNYLTSLRTDVACVRFSWEKYIPFVPAMIVPYMSIDLFFFGSYFLCTSKEELRAHARRVIFVILVAGVCFLLFPMRLEFERKIPQGIFAAWFVFLHKIDMPYNLAPSLHIALRSLIWVVYTRHTRRALRLVLQGWFVLIGVSTLLTYQHHALDVITGQFLAIFCYYLFPVRAIERPQFRGRVLNAKLVWIYSLLTTILLLAATALRPWGYILIWPAITTAVLAVGYAFSGERIFRKRQGVIPFTTRIILGPYLLAAVLWRIRYTRRRPFWCSITSNVWAGRFLCSSEAKQLVASGVTAVLDLTAEYNEPGAFRALRYLNVPILDSTAPAPDQVAECVAFIDAQAQHGIVYVHCALGYTRTTAIVAAWMVKTKVAQTLEQAIEKIQCLRPVVITPRALAGVREYLQQ